MGTMRITIATITGDSTELDVPQSATFGEVKAMIQDLQGVPASKQRLVFGNQPQKNNATLESVGVEEGHIVHRTMVEDEDQPGLYASSDEEDPEAGETKGL